MMGYLPVSIYNADTKKVLLHVNASSVLPPNTSKIKNVLLFMLKILLPRSTILRFVALL